MKLAALDIGLRQIAGVASHASGWSEFKAILNDPDVEVMYLLHDAVVIKCPPEKVVSLAMKLEAVLLK